VNRWHNSSCVIGLLVFALLAIHGGLLAYSAWVHSPTYCEVNHFPAGLHHLHLGRFDLFRVNPPLVRTVAALPVAFLSPQTDWKNCDNTLAYRTDMAVGQDFLKSNGERSLWFFLVARWACIPFSLLGGYVCYRFARELFGLTAGLLALILWCFCPYILGHASLITPDAPAAAMGMTACYAFWHWLKCPTVWLAIAAGLLFGLAQLTKTTLLVFYPLWPILWLIYRFPDHKSISPGTWQRESVLLTGILFLGLVIINLGYGFEGSFRRLGEFQFHSAALSGVDREASSSHRMGNRFSSTCLASLPVPLPVNYLLGIDTQRWDFERKMPSYLDGEWRMGGWWSYYLVALTIKLPLGVWLLFLLAIGASLLDERYFVTWRDELVLLLPAVTILMLVSSQTGFSIHSRYILPMLPFVFVWMSKVGCCVSLKQWKIAVLTGVLLTWSVGSSLWYYPHSLSYFNELIGGPTRGHKHLLDSNIAWGQDLYFLKRWYDENPDARPFHLAYFGLIDPRMVGIEFTMPPAAPVAGNSPADISADAQGPLPGWYAVDVNHLQGARLIAADGMGEWQYPAWNDRDLTYFQRFQPVDRIGYSIYIYHITPDEANRVRREIGLPEIGETREEEQ